MTTPILGGRRLYALVLSVTLAATAYLAFALWGGWREVLAGFVMVGPWGVLAMLALSLANYGLRFARWQLYLSRLGTSLAWRPSLRIYIAGFALTTTPGKAGEMLRGLFLKRHGMPYTHSTAAFVSERLSDLLAVVLIAMLGMGLHPRGGPIVLTGLGATALGMFVLSRGDWLRRLSERLDGATGRIARAFGHLVQLLVAARRCHTPSMLAIATLLSLVAWLAEAYAFYLALGWLGFDASPSFAFAVYALAMLAGALSFLPGGLGGAEAVMAGMLIWGGMGEAQAVAATVITRLATLWFAVLLGIAALLKQGEYGVAEATPTH